MKISDIKRELKAVIICQRQQAESIDGSNPSCTRLVTCAEDMAEIAEAILDYIEGDRVTIKRYQ
jgi:hypothetical protein